jgi:hypothetical protein
MTRTTRFSTLFALLSVSLGMASLSAACGGGAAGPGAAVPTGAPTETSSAGPATSSTPSAGTAALTSSGTAGAGTPAPAFTGPMQSPIKSAMLSDLTGAGLDPKKLPTMDKLDPKVMRAKVMPLFSKSLGIKCGDCHVEGDFAAPTRRKAIAQKMWDDFVMRLQMADGTPVFCDSCHQGRVLELDRHDKKALAKWMQANFVDPFKRRDKKDHECASCHGEDMDMDIISKWAQGQKGPGTL